MIDSATTMLDWFGVIVFAITGSLVASRKQMDVVGFAMLAVATGIGGGTLRDMLLGSLPVFWVQQSAYLATCVFVSVLVFFTAHIPQSRYRFVLWLDALGLATFAATGAQKAADAGANLAVAVLMGVITATFGGIIRDLLGGESPIILRREIYVSAALAGAATFACLVALDVDAKSHWLRPLPSRSRFVARLSITGGRCPDTGHALDQTAPESEAHTHALGCCDTHKMSSRARARAW